MLCRLQGPRPANFPKIKRLLITFTAFVLEIMVPSQCGLSAAELEVDNLRGSDLQTRENNGQTRTAYLTIQRAIDHASIGDTIRIRNTSKPYRECVSINSNHQLGTTIYPLIIEGSGATLDGSKPLGTLDWHALGKDLFELKARSPGYIRLLAESDQPVPENLGKVVDLAELKPLQYGRINGSIFFCAKPGEVPQSYGLRGSVEQTGITLYDTSNIVIRDLKVVGYRLDGINCHDLVNNVRFENIVAAENGRSGFSIGGASKVIIKGGELRGNGESQIRSEGQSETELVGVKIEAGKTKAIDQSSGRVFESR